MLVSSSKVREVSLIFCIVYRSKHFYTYSECQKKHHFFRAMLTKIQSLKMYHTWTQISCSTPDKAHLKNERVDIVKKEKIAVTLQKVIFQKSQKLLTENLHERPGIQNIQKQFIQFQWRVMLLPYLLLSMPNSVPERRAISVIFEKWPLAISMHFTPFWLNQSFGFWDVLGKEYCS